MFLQAIAYKLDNVTTAPKKLIPEDPKEFTVIGGKKVPSRKPISLYINVPCPVYYWYTLSVVEQSGFLSRPEDIAQATDSLKYVIHCQDGTVDDKMREHAVQVIQYEDILYYLCCPTLLILVDILC